MQEPGNSIVFFLGKTLIQSDLHLNKKVTSTTDIIELEKNFYDKLKLSVNEVQVILVPPGIKLEDYLVNCDNYDYKYHLLYPRLHGQYRLHLHRSQIQKATKA